MYPALGNVWDLKYDLPNISWNAPRPPDESCIPAIIQGLEYEIGQLEAVNAPIPGDFYFWGGAIAAKARLASVTTSIFFLIGVLTVDPNRSLPLKVDCRTCGPP